MHPLVMLCEVCVSNVKINQDKTRLGDSLACR